MTLSLDLAASSWLDSGRELSAGLGTEMTWCAVTSGVHVVGPPTLGDVKLDLWSCWCPLDFSTLKSHFFLLQLISLLWEGVLRFHGWSCSWKCLPPLDLASIDSAHLPQWWFFYPLFLLYFLVGICKVRAFLFHCLFIIYLYQCGTSEFFQWIIISYYHFKKILCLNCPQSGE